jgi:hypothetical protein
MVSKITPFKDRKQLAGPHNEPVRQALEKVLYPVNKDGTRLVDENNEPVDVFPKGHKGCRFHKRHNDETVAEAMQALDAEEFGYVKKTMVSRVRVENFGRIYFPPKPVVEPVSQPVTEPTTEPPAAIISIVEEYIIKLVNDCKGDIIKLVNDSNNNIGNNTHRLNVQAKRLDVHESLINAYAQRLTNQANRLDAHAKQISATMEGDLKLAKQFSELEKRVVALETHVMDMGKEAAELASSFRSLQGKTVPIGPSQDAGANGTNKR